MKSKENFRERNSGITLIALVVTIVILIILATISINAIFGEDGLIAKAEQAKAMQEQAREKEELELIKAAAMTDIENAGNLTVDGYIDELIEQGKIDETDITDNGDGTKTIITDEGYVVTISPDPDKPNDIIIDVEGEADALPVKIKDVKLTTSTNSIKVDLEVKRGEGATYKYYYKAESETDYTKAYEGSDLSYTIEKLAQNITYNIKVEATNENGTVSKVVTGRTGEIGTAVGVITFGEVSWNNGKAEIEIIKTTQDNLKMQYRVLDKESVEIKEYTEITSGEKITGLNSGDVVIARLWDGTNGGNTAVANIQDLVKPEVTLTQGTITSSSIQVNVQATDNESGIATYSYYKKLSTDSEYPVAATATTTDASYTFTNLVQNMSYDIKVEVSDVAGNKETGEIKSAIASYTITYDANGGSGAPEAQTVTGGTTVKLSATVPTRTGFTFLGWSTDASATSATYGAGANYTEGKPITLYAVWEITTLYYSGTGNAGNLTVTTGQIKRTTNGSPGGTIEVIIPSGGYTISASTGGGSASFGGTSIISGGTGSASYTTTEAGTLTISGFITVNLTYEGVAVPLQLDGYRIKYNANGGSWKSDPAMLAQLINKGEGYTTLASTNWYRNDYNFLGYSTDPNAIEATYTAGQTITPTKNMDLYVIWKKNEVCEIGNVKYSSLAKAFSAVQDGETIKMVKNETLQGSNFSTATLSTGKNVTLDMNGYTISLPTIIIQVEGDSSLEITGTGTINTYGGYAVQSNSTGTITINSGINCTSNTGNTIRNISTGTIIIDGATITQTANNSAITNSGGGLVWIKGEATIENDGSSYNAIYNSSGTIRIGEDDGTVDTTSPVITSAGIGISNTGTLEFYDGKISGTTAIENTGTIKTPTGYTTKSTTTDSIETVVLGK